MKKILLSTFLMASITGANASADTTTTIVTTTTTSNAPVYKAPQKRKRQPTKQTQNVQYVYNQATNIPEFAVSGNSIGYSKHVRSEESLPSRWTLNLLEISSFTQLHGSSDSSDSRSTNMGFGPGGALSADYRFSPLVSAEFGAGYVSESVQDPFIGATTITLTTNWIQVPLLFKLWPTDFFAIGLGGYLGFGVGDVSGEVSANDGSGSLSGSTSHETVGMKTLDYGLLADMGFHIPVTQTLRLSIQGRYEYGLANLTKNTDNNQSMELRSIEGIVGLGILL